MKYLTIINIFVTLVLISHMMKDKSPDNVRLKNKVNAIESVVIDHDYDLNRIKKVIDAKNKK